MKNIKLTKKQEQIWKELQKGKAITQIAQEVPCSIGYVSATKLKLEGRGLLKYSKKQPNLTAKQQEILNDLKKGRSIAEIEQKGISQGYISNMKKLFQEQGLIEVETETVAQPQIQIESEKKMPYNEKQKKVFELLEQEGQTLEEVAKKANVSRTYVFYLKNDPRRQIYQEQQEINRHQKNPLFYKLREYVKSGHYQKIIQVVDQELQNNKKANKKELIIFRQIAVRVKNEIQIMEMLEKNIDFKIIANKIGVSVSEVIQIKKRIMMEQKRRNKIKDRGRNNLETR